MTAYRLLALTAATGALAAASPAVAEPQTPGGVVFDSVPVIQPIDGPVSAPTSPTAAAPAERVTIYENEAELETHGPQRAPVAVTPGAPAYHGHGHAPPHAAGHFPASQPGFDREAWLDDCRDRIRGVAREDRGRVIGGLLGAVAGGVIGNRAWDSERLAGTLLGAGVGGLAGLAIGSAIGAASDRRREDECAWHLDRYMAGPYGAPHQAWGGYPAYGHGYVSGYGYGYPAVAYVPVLVQVPQRAVVREYVTEEWIEEPVPARARTVPHGKIIRQTAPSADKRTKLINTK